MGALPGIDVSHHQGLIDWAQVAGSRQRFAIGKATNGRTFVDPNFAYNKAGAEASGLAFGAYHFARPDDSANDAIIEAGRAEIYLDGPLVRTVDNYAPEPTFGVARSVSGLADGVHTLRIVVLGKARPAANGTLVSIDRFAAIPRPNGRAISHPARSRMVVSRIQAVKGVTRTLTCPVISL